MFMYETHAIGYKYLESSALIGNILKDNLLSQSKWLNQQIANPFPGVEVCPS